MPGLRGMGALLAAALGAACATTTTTTSGEARPVIAVHPIQDPSGVFNELQLEQLTTLLSTQLAMGSAFRVVPPSELPSLNFDLSVQ